MADWKDYNIQDEPAESTPLNTVTAEYLNGMGGAVKRMESQSIKTEMTLGGSSSTQFVNYISQTQLEEGSIYVVETMTVGGSDWLHVGGEHGFLSKVGTRLYYTSISNSNPSKISLAVGGSGVALQIIKNHPNSTITYSLLTKIK